MAHVKLLGHTYTLPTVVNARFCLLQQRANERYRLIQAGRRRRPRRWGLRPSAAVPLSPEECLQELSLLIRNYDALIDQLQQSKAAYHLFFARLAAGVRQALADKSATIRAIEQERLSSYHEALAQHDNLLQQLALEDEERLLQGVRLLGHVALLLLKKIAICQEGLTKLAEDQTLQRHLLTQLTRRLDNHRRAYERRKRIDQVVREVAEMAQVALEFEGYLRQHLGPFQDLLHRVVQVDAALHDAVVEIEAITQRVIAPGVLCMPATTPPDLTPFEQRLLDFLTCGQLKKERLAEIWQHLARQESQEATMEIEIDMMSMPDRASAPVVLGALDNIQMLVDMRLRPLLVDEETVLQTPLPLPQRFMPMPLRARVQPQRAWQTLVTTATRFSAQWLGSTDALRLEFVRIEAGTFARGSRVFADEQPLREVRISRSFSLGKYPVTQAQWEKVMGNNPSRFRGKPSRPVDNVSWEEVQEFLRKLNARARGALYRLPTEAEWEYAARAGSTTDYCFGNESRQLCHYAWYEANAGGTTHPVGQRKPNAWGLYDLYGNVWEWVHDWYDETYYHYGPTHDPQGPPSGIYRVVRGGAWNCDVGDCRSATRGVERAENRLDCGGFRLVLPEYW